MSKKAILLANLGSPDAPDTPSVRRYLREFLMDERVIDIPAPIRSVLVKGIIVPFRAPKSAAKYRSIWTENGSPLIHTTRELTTHVAQNSGLPTYMCMRYANPAPLPVLKQIAKEHPDLDNLIMVPMYPHYAMSSYETAVEHVKEAHATGGFPFKLNIVAPYYQHPQYIAALASTIAPFLEEHYDHVLFSYHGIPERHLKKADPYGHCLKCENCCDVPSEAHKICYRHQVIQTTKAVALKLGLKEDFFSFSFQSRLGSDRWLQPYTAKEFSEMPGRGIKRLLVVCPAFVSDCLETLEEIWMEGKEDFEKAGGQHFTAVPCLNTHPDWIATIDTLVKECEL